MPNDAHKMYFANVRVDGRANAPLPPNSRAAAPAPPK